MARNAANTKALHPISFYNSTYVFPEKLFEFVNNRGFSVSCGENAVNIQGTISVGQLMDSTSVVPMGLLGMVGC